MSARSIIFLFLAVVITGITVLFARGWLERSRQTVSGPAAAVVTEEEPKLEVLVAAGDLPVGRLLNANDFTWQPWPEDNISDAYTVRGKDRPANTASLNGAVVRRPIARGQPIAKGAVVRKGERGFLAAVLRPGYRAVAIPVTPASSIAGLAQPGDFVDVILSVETTQSVEGQKVKRYGSQTVLTNVRLLALDQKISDDAAKKDIVKTTKPAKTATLEVTPKQAEILALAARLGVMSLSLQSLARTEEELKKTAGKTESLSEQGPPERGRSFTLDYQISRFVNSTQKQQQGPVVQVARGSTTTDKSFPR